MRVSSISHSSYVNGPGKRAVLHTQGCTIGCADCINPHTWDPSGGLVMRVEDIVRDLRIEEHDGVTITGGEPLQQPEELAQLLSLIHTRTTVVLFTGYTKKYLERRGHVGMLSAHCDVVIAGPYIPKYNEFTEPRALRGSINQEVLILKGGISMCELTPLPDVEMVIQDDGSSVIRGFPDLRETLKDVVR